jgi:rRNA maturation endonuclease Nob1
MHHSNPILSSIQGGFYGSGGSRVLKSAPQHKPEALATQADIMKLTEIMLKVESLEDELRAQGSVVNTRTMEIRTRIKKMALNPLVREILVRLEIKGEPVWGLSSRERDLVREAKLKFKHGV